MRKLLFQLLLLLGSVGAVAALAIGAGVRRPYLDAFYTRFTTLPAGSLILGTSRAAQAVQPAVLQARLGRRYAGPWLNYAFTLQESPYGPAYLASVQRKLAAGTRHGLFIVTTDPWSLSMPRPARPGAPLVFPEDKSMIGQLRNVSQNPNWDYLANHLHLPFYRVLLHSTAGIVRLHPDGWLEVALPPPSADTARQRARTLEKLATYRPLAASSQLAAPRLHSLRQLIALLKTHGQVVLVRLPTGPALSAVENDYQPRFDQLMQHTADSLGVPYLNYLNQPYPTNDGNHLWRGAARTFSQRLADDIAALPAQ
jgi:hypothetical protein